MATSKDTLISPAKKNKSSHKRAPFETLHVSCVKLGLTKGKWDSKTQDWNIQVDKPKNIHPKYFQGLLDGRSSSQP